MTPDWRQTLDADRGVVLYVEFEKVRREIVSYAVVLVVERGGSRETVRVYDGVHGRNELHRYTRAGGKQPAEVFDRGTLGEGMRAAITICAAGYEEMIDAWAR